MQKLLCFLALLALLSCANSKYISKGKVKKTYISVKTVPCFGACPLYDMEVFGSGKISLYARKFMQLKGAYTGSIDQDAIHEIALMAKKMSWHKYATSYRTGYSDLPSIRLKYSGSRGDTTEVWFELDAAPVDLKNLALHLQEIRKNADWKPKGD